MWSIAHVTSGYHIGRCRPWPNTGEFRLCCRLEGEPRAGSCHSLRGHCRWEVTVQQPSPRLPLQTDINYCLPWATPCAKNFTSIIPYHPQSYLEVLLLLLGHKRLCKLPNVRELLSGSARIQNQFCLTVEFKLFLSVLHSFPPAPLDIRTWMAAISFRTCPTARSGPLPSMPVSAYSPFSADSAWASQPALQPSLPRLWW